MLTSRTVRTGLIALAMAGLTVVVFVALASASAEGVGQGQGGIRKARIKYSFCSGPTTTVWKTFTCPAPWPPTTNAPNNLTVAVGATPLIDCDGNGTLDMFIGSVSYNCATDSFYVSDKPMGNATGGGLQTQGLPDTLSASVGFYSPGVPPVDSMVAVRVERNPTNVTLSLFAGGLQVRMPGGRETSIARLRVFVYPNLAAADADSVNRTGAGTLPGGMGVVELNAGASNVHLTGNLSDRYSVRSESGGRYSARLVGNPAPLVVNVSDQSAAEAATVVVLAHAESFRPVGAPGIGTVGLTILALLLAGSGVWAVRSRRRAATA